MQKDVANERTSELNSSLKNENGFPFHCLFKGQKSKAYELTINKRINLNNVIS